MHRTRGVLIRNFGRRQDPGLDELRLEIVLVALLGPLYTKFSIVCPGNCRVGLDYATRHHRAGRERGGVWV